MLVWKVTIGDGDNARWQFFGTRDAAREFVKQHGGVPAPLDVPSKKTEFVQWLNWITNQPTPTL